MFTRCFSIRVYVKVSLLHLYSVISYTTNPVYTMQAMQVDIVSYDSFKFIPSSTTALSRGNLARNKVVTTGTSVGNNTSQLIIVVENNTVRAGGTTGVNLAAAQNRELIVGAGDGEIEALIVVVDVGVAVIGRTGLVQLVTAVLGGADGAAGVAN